MSRSAKLDERNLIKKPIDRVAAPRYPAPMKTARTFNRKTHIIRYSALAALAGFLPLPVADILLLAGVQAVMLWQMLAPSKDEVKVKWSRGAIVIAITSIVPVIIAGLFSTVIQILPLIGGTLALLALPVLAAGATYVLGTKAAKLF